MEGDIEVDSESLCLAIVHKCDAFEVVANGWLQVGNVIPQVLSQEGIHTNVTLVFSPAQALLAARAGATYVSPFMGRLDDADMEAEALIRKIADVKALYGYETEIISASIRNLKHVEMAALAGSDIATIPYKVLMKMIEHPLTTAGLKIFADAAK